MHYPDKAVAKALSETVTLQSQAFHDIVYGNGFKALDAA